MRKKHGMTTYHIVFGNVTIEVGESEFHRIRRSYKGEWTFADRRFIGGTAHMFVVASETPVSFLKQEN